MTRKKIIQVRQEEKQVARIKKAWLTFAPRDFFSERWDTAIDKVLFLSMQ